jgi:hypothetical protein
VHLPDYNKASGQCRFESKRRTGADSFDVVTLGFDTVHDIPAMMRHFRDTQQVNDDNW